jgi:hypothetical protein
LHLPLLYHDVFCLVLSRLHISRPTPARSQSRHANSHLFLTLEPPLIRRSMSCLTLIFCVFLKKTSCWTRATPNGRYALFHCSVPVMLDVPFISFLQVDACVRGIKECVDLIIM